MSKAMRLPTAGDTVPGDDAIPEVPVFDRSNEDMPWPQDETLPADEEGNDPLDDDPNDNGDQEQFDPQDQRHDPAAGI